MRKTPLRSTLKVVVGLAAFLALLAGVLVGLAPVYAQAPEQSRDFFGVVLSIENDVLLVAAEDDVIEVSVDPKTSIWLPLKADAAITDLAEGDQIAVSLGADGTAVADKIFLIPTKTRFRHVFGTVAAVSDTQITIQPTIADADPITFDLTNSTRISLRGVVSELQDGVRVVIVAERDEETGEISTEAIEVSVVRPTASVDVSLTAEIRVTTIPASIKGVFQRIDPLGRWVVSGTVVVVNIDTEIDQGIVVGEEIEIDGYLSPDDTIAAAEIRRVVKQQVARRARFEGVFEGEDAEGRWIINGHALVVDHRSDTDGQPEVGESVIVSAVELDDGTLVVREIENIGFTRKSLETKTVTIQGTLRAQVEDGLWRVNAFLVRLDSDTTITGHVAIGSPVRVTALRRATGGLLAISIEGLSRSEPKVEKTVSIEGIVTRIDEDGAIMVGERTINTSDLTEIEGDLTEGVQVKVSAVITDDQTLSARQIEVGLREVVSEPRKVEIEGIVESINGSIVVNGVTVVRDSDTQIEGRVEIGTQVTVIGWIDANGSLVARIVRGEDRGVTRNGTELRLAGKIEGIERDDGGQISAIRVDNTTILIVELTKIAVRLSDGVEVDVNGVIVDGHIVARTIRQRAVTDSDLAQTVLARSLSGVIESIGANESGDVTLLKVNGIEISFTDATRVDGELAVGASVTVQGVVRNDTFFALSVKVSAESNAPVVGRPFELAGRVNAITLNRADGLTGIVVAGRTITGIPGRTKIEGDLVIGAEVKIEGRILDGTHVAVTITVTAPPDVDIRPDPEPTPTVSTTVGTIGTIRGKIQVIEPNTNDRPTSIVLNGVRVTVGAQVRVPDLLKKDDTVEIRVRRTDGEIVAVVVRLIARATASEEQGEPTTTTPPEVTLDAEEDVGESESTPIDETLPPTITISGLITAASFDQADRATFVVIDGRSVVVTPLTVVSGTVRRGAQAEVEAAQLDGRLVAVKIEVKAIVDSLSKRTIDFSGVVRRVDLDGSDRLIAVTIGALRGVITSETEVSGRIVVGAQVRGKAVLIEGTPNVVVIEAVDVAGSNQNAGPPDSVVGNRR